MEPTLGEPFAAAPDTHVIPTYWPVPNVGVIPMNAFVIRAAEPVLVDTGTGALTDDFVDALTSIVRPTDLRWIWLTHEDRDHTGSLLRLLELAPEAKVVTTFMAVGRMLPEHPFPLDRLRLVNPGEAVNIGDRNLLALRPPLFDSPATVGFLDDRSGLLFSSDCFGAPLPTAGEAAAHRADQIDPETLAAAQTAWATVDSPWVTMVDQAALAHALDTVRATQPRAVLSSHLPPIHDCLDRVAQTLARTPSADPVPGVTQTELEALLAGFEPVSPDPAATDEELHHVH